MDDPELKQAIESLQQKHALGKKIKGMLRRKPKGKNYLTGEYERVAAIVGKEAKLNISPAMARKMVEFSERYTDKHLATLVKQCRTHKHAPGFDSMMKLMPVRPLGVRNKIQLLAIKNRWPKEKLSQTIRNRKATKAYAERDDDVQDIKYQGRSPRATQSLESLLGELKDAAIRWRHIWYVLEKPGEDDTGQETVWSEMGEELQAGVRELVDLLTELARFEVVE